MLNLQIIKMLKLKLAKKQNAVLKIITSDSLYENYKIK